MKQYKAILLIGIICFTIFLNSCHQEINEKTYKVSYIDYNGEVIQISEVKKAKQS